VACGVSKRLTLVLNVPYVNNMLCIYNFEFTLFAYGLYFFLQQS